MDEKNYLGKRGFASVLIAFFLILLPLSYYVGRQLEIREVQRTSVSSRFFLGRNFEDYPYENGLRIRVFYPYPIAVWENGWFYYFVKPIEDGYLIETPYENILFTLDCVSYENNTTEVWSVNGEEVIWEDIGWTGDRVWREGRTSLGIFREEVELREKLPPIIRGIFTSEVENEIYIGWKLNGEVENLGILGLYSVNGNLVQVEDADVSQGSLDAVWKRQVGRGTSVIVDPVVSYGAVTYTTFFKLENLSTGKVSEVPFSGLVAVSMVMNPQMNARSVSDGYALFTFDWVGVENVILSFLSGSSVTWRYDQSGYQEGVSLTFKVGILEEEPWGFDDVIKGIYIGSFTSDGTRYHPSSFLFGMGRTLENKPETLILGFWYWTEFPPVTNYYWDEIGIIGGQFPIDGGVNLAMSIKVVYYPSSEMPVVSLSSDPNVFRFQVNQAGSRMGTLILSFEHFDEEHLNGGNIYPWICLTVSSPEGIELKRDGASLSGIRCWRSGTLPYSVNVSGLPEGNYLVLISGNPYYELWVAGTLTKIIDAPFVKVNPVKILVKVASWIDLSVQSSVDILQSKVLEIPVGVRVHEDLIGHTIIFRVSGLPPRTRAEIENIVGGIERVTLRIITENASLGSYQITLEAYCPDFDVSSSARFTLNVVEAKPILVAEPITNVQPTYCVGDTIEPRIRVRNEGNLDWEGYYSWILNIGEQTYGGSFSGRVPMEGENVFTWKFKLPIIGHAVLKFKVEKIEVSTEFDVLPTKPIPWSIVLVVLTGVIGVSSYFVVLTVIRRRR